LVIVASAASDAAAASARSVRFGEAQASLPIHPALQNHGLHTDLAALEDSLPPHERFFNLPSIRPILKKGEVIEFELFDGMIALGDVKEVMMRDAESSSWTGSLRKSNGGNGYENVTEEALHEEDGYFGVSCVKKACVANLYIASTHTEYKISPAGSPLSKAGEGIYALRKKSLRAKQANAGAGAEAGDGLEALTVKSALSAGISSSSADLRSESMSISTVVDTDLILDIVVLYTPEALAASGGR